MLLVYSVWESNCLGICIYIYIQGRCPHIWSQACTCAIQVLTFKLYTKVRHDPLLLCTRQRYVHTRPSFKQARKLHEINIVIFYSNLNYIIGEYFIPNKTTWFTDNLTNKVPFNNKFNYLVLSRIKKKFVDKSMKELINSL